MILMSGVIAESFAFLSRVTRDFFDFARQKSETSGVAVPRMQGMFKKEARKEERRRAEYFGVFS